VEGRGSYFRNYVQRKQTDMRLKKRKGKRKEKKRNEKRKKVK